MTDRRLLFIQGRGPVRWIGHRELRDVALAEHRDGTGDIIFTRNSSNLEQLNAGQFRDFTENWLDELVVGRNAEGGPPDAPDDPGIRETFVGIARPRAVRDLVLASLQQRGRDLKS